MNADMLPPQNIEVEKLVLGALLLESDAYDNVPFLKPEMFYQPAHYFVFEAIQNLKNRREVVDMVTVSKELNRVSRLTEMGGIIFISSLTDRIGSSAHIEAHAKVIRELWGLRKVVAIMSRLQRNCYTDDVNVEELIVSAQKDLAAVQAAFHTGKDVKHISEIIAEEIELYAQKAEAFSKGRSYGISTGIQEVDQHTSGWQKSDLIVIGARPSMGKTAYALGLAKAAALNCEQPGVFFSLEMSNVQLVQRLLIEDSEVNSYRFKHAQLGNGEIDSVHDSRKRLSAMGIYLDETPGLEITELCAKARRMKQFNNIGWVVVDHIHLVRCRTFQKDTIRAVSEISRTLKELAKELDVPVIVLAQLNREVEKRGGDMRPRLSDLRESGSIEQDADIVMFIHRPEYYGMTQDSEGNLTAGMAELIFAKYRNGATGTIDVRWIESLMKFKSKNGVPISSQFPALQPNNEFLNTPHPY